MADKDTASASYWIAKLTREEKAHGKLRKAAKASEKDYFDTDDQKRQLFNLHKSTVDTLHARLYSKAPNPDVRRRFDMPGPQGAVAKEAALLIERAIGFTIDTTDFHLQADQVVSDFLRASVGVPWLRYEAKV